MLQWFKSLWKNGYSFWIANIYNDDVNAIFDGDFAPLVFNEVDHSSIGHAEKSAIPLISGYSSIILWMARNMTHVPIYCIPSKLSQLKDIQQIMSSEPTSLQVIEKQDTTLLLMCIFRFLSCFGKNLTLDQLENLNSVSYPEFWISVKNEIPEFIATNVNFMLDLVAKLNDCPESTRNFIRGKLWISYSSTFLQCLIPDFDLDPVEIRKAKLDFLSYNVNSVSAQLLVDVEFQLLQTSHNICKGKAEKLQSLKKFNERNLKLKRMLPLRPATSQLSDLMQDLRNLKNQILGESKIDVLCISIENQEENWMQQEISIQQILATIADRLETKYPMYRDLIDPVITAIFQLKYGLRIFSHSALKSKDAPLTQLMFFMIDFASCDILSMKSVAYICNSIKFDNLVKLKTYIALERKLAILLQNPTHSDQNELISFSSDIFFAIVELWSDVEKEKAQKAEEAQSLYTMKNHIIRTAEEEAEEDFLDLFPDFLHEFADLDPNEDNSKEQTNLNQKLASELDLTITIDVVKAFKALSYANTKDIETQWKGLYVDSFNVVADLARTEKLILDRSFDEKGYLGYLFISRLRIHEVESFVTSSGYDFYNDSNIAEVQQVRSLLINYSESIHKPLKKWPERDVLLNLDILCKRILSFPATSPIIRFLTGIELLLIKSDDWEKYSSKEYSLKNVLNDMTSLIVKWRKLELESWKDLLEVEAKKATCKVSNQWFHLFKILQGSSFSEVFNN